MGNVNWLMIRSEVILSLSVEGGSGVGSGAEVFNFYISSVVVKWWWWPKIAEWHCIVPEWLGGEVHYTVFDTSLLWWPSDSSRVVAKW